MNAPFINVAASDHEGVDLGLRYVLPKFPFGNVVLNSEWSYLVKSRSTQRPANQPVTETDDMNTSGVARWRGTTNVSWRRGAWTGNLGAYYVGPSQGGASTSQAVWESLGRPGYIARQFTGGQFVYRYVVESTITYNASLGYRFGADAARWLRGSRVRLGLANLTDKEPPLSTGAFGYDPAVSQNLLAGRTWSLEIAKPF